MAHTLNEQTLHIPAGTAAENIELILDGIAEAIGGYRSGYGVYFDEGCTAGVYFRYTGSDTCRVDYIGNGLILEYSSSFNLTSGTNIFYHVSTDEKTKYLGAYDNSYFQLVFALNEGGEYVCFSGDSAQNYIMAGAENVSLSAQTFYIPHNTNQSYTITKCPDIYHGKVFESLYFCVSSGALSLRNQLVNFDGAIYRVVVVGSSESQATLAFPVSDE